LSVLIYNEYIAFNSDRLPFREVLQERTVIPRSCVRLHASLINRAT